MLATANIRYAELTDRLDEEKKRAALLEVGCKAVCAQAAPLGLRFALPSWGGLVNERKWAALPEVSTCV